MRLLPFALKILTGKIYASLICNPDESFKVLEYFCKTLYNTIVQSCLLKFDTLYIIESVFQYSVWFTKIVYYSSPHQTMRIHTEDTDGGAAASPGNDARGVWCNFPTGSCDHRETDSSSDPSGPVTMELIVQCLFTALKVILIRTVNLIINAKIFVNNANVNFGATVFIT